MKEPIEIVCSEDVKAFWRLHVKSAQRRGFTARSLDYLRAQWDALAPSGAVWILLAQHKGESVAAKWVTVFGGTATSRLDGWDADASGKLHVNVALHWAAIQRARDAGAKVYDFSGFDRAAAELILSGERFPDQFKRTPHFFKLEFGGDLVVMPRARFRLINGFANKMLRPIAPTILASPMVTRAAKRFRNG